MASNYEPGMEQEGQGASSGNFREVAQHELESAREQVRNAGQTIREETSGLASAVREKITESSKSVLTSGMDDFTAAVRKASEELGERNQSAAASIVRQAASTLEHATDAIKGKSLQEIGSSIASFARERPAAFYIGAVLAGVAIGRFARASGRNATDDWDGESDTRENFNESRRYDYGNAANGRYQDENEEDQGSYSQTGYGDRNGR